MSSLTRALDNESASDTKIFHMSLIAVNSKWQILIVDSIFL